MAQIITLTDRKTGEAVYPVTSTKAVFDEKGEDLDTLLSAQKQETEDALKDYAKKTDLSGKQDALTDSLDVKVSETALTVTERAKRAVFIDQWNTACGIWGRYNEETGYFELNGLTDITYEEALRIYEVGAITTYDCAGFYNVKNNGFIRTNLPRKIDSQWGYNSQGFNAHNFFTNKGIEVLNIEPFWGEDPNGFIVDSRLNGHGITSNFYNFADNEWENRVNLRKIIGVIDLRLMPQRYQFNALTFCTKLVDVKIRNCGCYMKLHAAAKLSLESVRYLAENATATAEGITIRIESVIYAKLTGDTTNEEVAAMDPEELQKWMELVPLAAEKNITFVA